MKKVLSVLIAAALALSLAACGSSSSSAAASTAASTASSAAASTAASSTAASSTAAAGALDTSKLSDAAKTRLAEIQKAGKLTLGTSADYSPFEFHATVDGADKIVGIDVDLAQKVADAMGVKLEITDMSFDNLLISLNKGDFDVVMAALSPTEERAKAVDFSEIYFKDKQVVLIRTADAAKYTTTDSLKGKAVTAQKGAIQEGIANDVAGSENVVLLTKVGDEVAELMNNKVEAVFLDNAVAAGYAAVHSDLTMADIGINYESEGSAAACKKGDTGLVEIINAVLGNVSEDEMTTIMANNQKLAGIE